jgi:hypothetical protein
MYLKWVLRTLPRDDEPDVLKLGAYPHNVYQRHGISGPGTFSIGFGTVREAEKPALLWLYNRTRKAGDEKNSTPCESTSGYPHHVIMAFLNWPFGMEEKNPADCIPRAAVDERFGFYAFRDRFEDENDVIIQVQTLNTRGWHKASTDGSVHLWAMGKKEKWGKLPGKLRHSQIAADGSAILTDRFGTSMAIDFSKSSGADVMLVMTGRFAGKSNTTAKLGDQELRFRFFNHQSGATPPKPQIDGDTSTIGTQTISIKNGNLSLSRFAEN